MRIVGIILWVALSTAAWAADERGEPVTIDAKQLSFDRPNDLAYGEGDVVVRYRDAVLRADRVRVNTETKEIWADGQVRLDREGQEWVAPSVYYNFQTREFRAEDVRVFFAPVHVRGHSVTGVGTNHFTLRSVSLTPCDYDPPHFRVQATRAEIWPGDRVVLHNVTVRAGGVPVFWLPVLSWPLTEDGPLLSISAGHSSEWGYFVLTSLGLRWNPQLQTTIHLDERTERGPGGGLDVNYRVGNDGRGQLRGYYLNDHDPIDDTDAGKDITEHRYRAQWQHKQTFPGDVSLTVDVNRWSDPDVLDDFFSHEFTRDREPQTVADVTKRGANYTLSLQARAEVNPWFAEVQRLPEVKLAVNRTRLWETPLFYEGETSAGYYDNHAGDNADVLFEGESVRVDTFHQLLLPHTFGGWLAVVPRGGARVTYYLNAPDTAADTNEVHRYVYDLGLETSFKLSRTWSDLRSRWLQLDGLRHIIQPFANYAWVPDPNVQAKELYPFDAVRTVTLANGETLPVTRYLPAEFPAYNTIDAISRQHFVRFGLRQRLQTRREGNPWDLVELEGWTDYRIEREDDETDFSDLYGTLRLHPWGWCRLEASTRYDVTDGVLRELNTGVHLAHRDRWSIGFGTRYLEADSSLISADVAVRLSRRWTVAVYGRIDVEDGTWEEQELVLRQETHDWYINYGVRYRERRTTDDEVAVFVGVTLKAFPDISLRFN